MNSYGKSNTNFSVSPSQRHEYLHLFSGGSVGFYPPSNADHVDEQPHLLNQQNAAQMQSMQKQSAFHTRVRDMYFASWGGQQQQQRLQQRSESPWQGHKNPKVYEGDEVHCFNTFCTMTFRYNTHLVAHIMGGECGTITADEILFLVRDWKSLQMELCRCGKLSNDEISCLERAWDYLQAEQQKSSMITRELIGFLVFAWEILSGNRSRYTLTPPNAASSLMQERSVSEGIKVGELDFDIPSGTAKGESNSHLKTFGILLEGNEKSVNELEWTRKRSRGAG